MAGIVSFAARLRPDGSVESVEIHKMPMTDLGFEQAVRACVTEWRFTPAPSDGDGARVYEGTVRFRRAPSEELLIRTRLEELAAAWNQHDEAAVAELQARLEDAPETPTQAAPLVEQVQALTMTTTRRIRLADDVQLLWFLRSDAVKVRQPYRILSSEAGEDSGEASFFEASLMKGSRGWRFVSLFAPPTDQRILRVGDQIKEPRKIRNVPPVYPDIAKQVHVQGVVTLEATISAEGVVTWVKVVRGVPLLDQAAVDAVQQWRYTPTLLNGVAVPVIMTVTVAFRLR